MCGTIVHIPKRIFIYYDDLGINKKEIFAIDIFLDTKNLMNSTVGVFNGTLFINDQVSNAKSDLSKLKHVENTNIDLGAEFDPIGCHGLCKLYQTNFMPGEVRKEEKFYNLDAFEITLTYNLSYEIVRVRYYKK